MKKRIALFINSSYGGGAERVVSILSDQLNKEYELYIFLIDAKTKFYEYKGKVINLGGNSSNFVLNLVNACFSIKKKIKQYNIEVVISFLDFPNIINVMFNDKCKKAISIRSQMDESIYNTFRESVKLKLAKKNFRKADMVISVAEEMNKSMGDDFGIDGKKRCTIVNPYDIERIIKMSQESIPDDIEDFIINHETAIAVGRIDDQKDYETLIEIFLNVSKKNDKSTLIVLGTGSLENQMQRRVHELGIDNKVMFLGIQKNPFAFMRRCKLYVSASKYEGFPNSLVEAMVCGLACIHTDCKTGPREILSDNTEDDITQTQYGRFGVLVPSYTRGKISRQEMIDLYVSAWLNLLNNKKMQEEYSQMSRVRAEKFSIEQCVISYKNVIENLTK